jgi:HK97 family phage prohead protease
MQQITTRYVPLDDLEIKKDGTGRTVRAYCAVFDVDQEISDFEGDYVESLARTSFNRTIAQVGSWPVFFNHGATIQGAPSELYSMPLGRGTAEVQGKGVLTETKYARTQLADDILEHIREGVIKGQSFSGRTLRSAPSRPRGGYRRSSDGALPRVVRHEIAMTEFGPTPFPYYPGATIEGVRSLTVVRTLDALLNNGTISESSTDDELLAAVRAALDATPSGDSATRTATSSEPGADQRSAPLRRHQIRAALYRMGLHDEQREGAR